MARRYFGTDGVRGVVGEDLTVELVEQLGRAATLWSDGGRVFVGRDTRGSGEELEEAFGRGIVAAGGNAVLAGVLPTPAVALLALDLGAVISASHNPPEYNGVKLFDGEGQKLTDAAEEEIEALFDVPFAGNPGQVDHVGVAEESYLDHIVERFGSDLSGLKVVVDCANGAYSGIAPTAFERLGADVTAIGCDPDGTNINVGCGATDLSTLQQAVTSSGANLGVAFDGDGDRMLAVDARGEVVDGDQILAILMLHLARRPGRGDGDGEPRPAPPGRGARDPRRHHRRRRPLRDRGAAPRARRARRRAVGPHHLPARPRHRRRPGGGAAALRRARGPARSRRPRP